MADIFSKAKRSDVMSRIRSRGNAATELALVRVFRTQGMTGWRRHLEVRVPVGKAGTAGKAVRPFRVRPDFVFPRLRLALFVDGCFWHGCPQHGTKPRGNAAFWRKKFAANRARDLRVTRMLRRHGWRVLRIWEHELKWPKARRETVPVSKAETRLLGRLRRAGLPPRRRGGGERVRGQS
ncbi:MAG TPA: very short patch repair endonuclease [Candidatus Limnocylindria bacterium]|jgi:DNA mismatch endonuclease (patch repair protein)|nr:very short patch repair endonuclease [Candidatus Limnocylindria bacterium]